MLMRMTLTGKASEPMNNMSHTAKTNGITDALIDARRASGLTQKDLADRTGIAQADISKLENGNANPSLKTLQRLADGMGMKLKLEFVPANR